MRIKLPSGTPAEIAHPRGQERGTTGLVIIPDNGGLRSLFDEMCQQLANDNDWTVCAIELWPGREHLDKDEKWKAVPLVDERAVVADIEAAADATGCRVVNVIGFCMGGMYAFRAAGMSDRFEKAVSFYGMIRLPQEALSPTQHDPIEALQGEHAPVLALMGGKDPWCPASHIADLEKVPGVNVVHYPEAGHAFAHDPSREEHRIYDSQDAWQKAIEFLEN